jgi:hypothetical protein
MGPAVQAKRLGKGQLSKRIQFFKHRGESQGELPSCEEYWNGQQS